MENIAQPQYHYYRLMIDIDVCIDVNIKSVSNLG